MSFDAHKNFAKVTVAKGYTASATSIAVGVDQGVRLPSAPFDATWWNSTDYIDPADDPAREIVRVTEKDGDVLTVLRAQQDTDAVAHSISGKMYKLVSGVSAKTLDDIESSFPASSNILAKLSAKQQKMVRPLIQATTPAAGETVTLATLPGAGQINLLWLTLSDKDSAWNDVLQIFYGGESTPSFEADLGTLFLTHLSGHTVLGGAYSTDHMHCGPYGPGKDSHPDAMSGGIRFPIPYSDGCVIKLKAPAGGTAAGSQNLYLQIAYQEGITSNLRLCSKCLPWLQKATYTNSDIITFFDLQNTAGWLVWMSAAIKGASNITYLERVWFFGVDGEDVTPDENGVVTTAFSCSGGEDLFLSGWYFLGLNQISGEPYTIVTATNNGAFETVAGFDFLAAYGGLKFDNALKPGWSLKPGNYITTSHDMSWLFLYYKDTAAPFVPTTPTLAGIGASQIIVYTITPPTSPGSQPITGYELTLTHGAVETVYGIDDPSATEYTVDDLTDGVDYSATIKAVNLVGKSPASNSVDATPNTLDIPVITVQPTSVTKTINQSASFSVTATGTITGYQWKKNGTNIGGATSSTYTIASVLLSDAATYTVVVAGPDGSVTSSGAILTVSVPAIPSITSAAILSQFMANSLSASDGDLIASWTKNTGSSSVSFSQATSGNRPTFKTNISNGLPALRFAAAGPNMFGPSGSYNTAAPCGVIAALKPVATSDQRVWDTNLGGGAHGRALGGINSASKWSTYAGTGDAIGATAASAFTVVAWVQNGASSYVSTNGVKGTLANAGSGGIDTMIIGADAASSPASTFDGDLLELIVFSGNISDADRHALEVYLGAKYAITIS